MTHFSTVIELAADDADVFELGVVDAYSNVVEIGESTEEEVIVAAELVQYWSES